MSNEDKVQPDLVVGHEGDTNEVSYTKRDLLIYAVGIGCKNTPAELPFLYEDHENFVAFPTFPIVLPFKGTSHDVVPFPSPTLFSFPPGLPVMNPAMTLHAEQAIYILEPLPTSGATLTTKSKILGIYDKGKGALMREETRFTDEQGRLVAVAISGSFLRGVTGFQSKGPELPARIIPPSRAPDAVVQEMTLPEQALIYRLSGDYNSLHADPEIAQTVGFDKPILHGLCTFGHSARAVLQCGLIPENNPALLRSMTARFSKPAYPGETLVTSCWKIEGVGGQRIVFQTTIKERGVVVLEGGMAEIGEAGISFSKL
ncbi:peroxisomal hydratase-dehydrogenase- [Nannochloropsis oceanica]